MLVHHPLGLTGRARGIHPESHIGCSRRIFRQVRFHRGPRLPVSCRYDGVARRPLNGFLNKKVSMVLRYNGRSRATILEAVSDQIWRRERINKDRYKSGSQGTHNRRRVSRFVVQEQQDPFPGLAASLEQYVAHFCGFDGKLPISEVTTVRQDGSPLAIRVQVIPQQTRSVVVSCQGKSNLSG